MHAIYSRSVGLLTDVKLRNEKEKPYDFLFQESAPMRLRLQSPFPTSKGAASVLLLTLFHNLEPH